MWSPVAPSISWALIRTRPPALRTLPSRMWLTSSFRAISRQSIDCPLKVKAVLRAITPSAEIFDRSVVMSSLIPSLKYSCSESPLMFWKGSTQIDN